MFVRFLKHQLKSTWKEFNIAYGILFLAILMLSFLFSSNLVNIFFSVTIVAVIIVISLIVYYSIKLFTSLYEKEGYLTFSLPISSHILVLSKILAVLIYSFGFVLDVGLSVLTSYVILGSSFNEFYVEFLSIWLFDNFWVNLINVVYGFLNVCGVLIVFQLILALSNTCSSSKKKKWLLICLIWGYCVIASIVESIDLIDIHLCYIDNKLCFVNGFYNYILADCDLFSVWSLLLLVGEIVCGYYLTIYILDNRIEL